MTSKYGMGALKDPVSSKDFPAARLLRGLEPVALPKDYQTWKNEPLTYQDGTPECVPYGMTEIRRLHELVEVGKYPDFDAHALYLRCKEKDGIPEQGGTYPRVALDIMLHEGMPVKGYLSESIFPCMRKSNFHPGYKIGGYWRIQNETDDQIKQIIYQFGPISCACTWYDEWSNMDGVEVFRDPIHTSGEGHHWVIDGWRDDLGWRVLNQWGIVWGKGGIAYMPFSMYRAKVLPEGDVWKLTDTITTNKALGRLLIAS